MPLDKQGYILRHECCQMTGVQFLPLEMPTFTQAMKLKLGRNQFDKRKVCDVQTRICLWKNTHNQTNEIIKQIDLSKIIPIVSFMVI